MLHKMPPQVLPSGSRINQLHNVIHHDGLLIHLIQHLVGDRLGVTSIEGEVAVEPHFHLAVLIDANHRILHEGDSVRFEDLLEAP